MKAISINKPNAIFHMTEIDNDIESWIEFEDDPTFFKDGEEISVIVKKEKSKWLKILEIEQNSNLVQ